MTVCNLVLTPIVRIIRYVVEIARTIVRTVCGWVSSVITVIKTVVEKICSWLPWPLNKVCDFVSRVIEVLETVWEWICESLFETIIDIVEGFFEYVFFILRWVCWLVDWIVLRWLDLLLCHLGVHGDRCIRVCLKILTDREGNASTTRERALEMIGESNILLRQCKITLLVESVEFLEKPDLMENVPCGFGALFTAGFSWFSSKTCDCCSSITIYFIRTIDGGARGCAIPFTSWILVAVNNVVDQATIVHEIGHQAGLIHSSDNSTVMSTSPPRTEISKGQCCMIRTASFTTECRGHRLIDFVERPPTPLPHEGGGQAPWPDQSTRPVERLEQIGGQLRAKITSKFTASTFLAGFALTVLTGQIFTLHQDANNLSPLYPISVGAIFGALCLFIFAIIKLDHLTMPKRFWEHSQTASAGFFLEDRDLEELKARMMFFWKYLTMLATITTTVAVMGMLVPFPLLGLERPPEILTIQRYTFFAALTGALTALIYCGCVSAIAHKRFGPLQISD